MSPIAAHSRFLGGVNTQHHCVKLSVRSVLDACGDDGSEGYAEDEEEMEGSHMLEDISQQLGGLGTGRLTDVRVCHGPGAKHSMHLAVPCTAQYSSACACCEVLVCLVYHQTVHGQST